MDSTHANPKNTLQIHCQRQKWPLPVYTYTCVTDSAPAVPMWQSIVTVQSTAGPVEARSETCARKTTADMNAAENMLGILGLSAPVAGPDGAASGADVVVTPKFGPLEIPIPDAEDQDPVYVLVDYENVNKLEHLHHLFRREASSATALVCKFVGYCNQKADTDEPTHVAQSAASDAVDHYISFCLGLIVRENRGKKTLTVMIVSRDSFAAHHVKLTGGPVTVLHYTTEARCVESLKRMGYTETTVRPSYQDCQPA